MLVTTHLLLNPLGVRLLLVLKLEVPYLEALLLVCLVPQLLLPSHHQLLVHQHHRFLGVLSLLLEHPLHLLSDHPQLLLLAVHHLLLVGLLFLVRSLLLDLAPLPLNLLLEVQLRNHSLHLEAVYLVPLHLLGLQANLHLVQAPLLLGLRAPLHLVPQAPLLLVPQVLRPLVPLAPQLLVPLALLPLVPLEVRHLVALALHLVCQALEVEVLLGLQVLQLLELQVLQLLEHPVPLPSALGRAQPLANQLLHLVAVHLEQLRLEPRVLLLELSLQLLHLGAVALGRHPSGVSVGAAGLLLTLLPLRQKVPVAHSQLESWNQYQQCLHTKTRVTRS